MPLHVVDPLDRQLVDRDDQILRTEARRRGGRARDHLDHFDAGASLELPGETRRQRASTGPAKPCGLPIATTSWPTRSPVASPSSAGTSSVESARSTARSESGSAPTTSACTSVPSTKLATIRVARSTTWAEVTMKPSLVIATPLPPPRRLRRFATDGARRSLTAITAWEYASSAFFSSTTNR